MKAKITITLKGGVLDPQGKAIEGALKGLGFDGAREDRRDVQKASRQSGDGKLRHRDSGLGS